MVDGIEIDFMPVGEGERSGDAIAIRWREGNQYKVLVYDGGTSDYGEILVNHVKTYFETDRVDYVVNSHPDNDHAGGLLYVLENLQVGELWMHRPWSYSAQIREYFDDGRMTNASLAERLKQKMSAAHNLEKAAKERKIPILEPFAGSKIGVFIVLSPTKDRYVHDLIPAFEKSPELKKAASVVGYATDMLKAAASYVADVWHKEYLPETVTTSAENESSTILFAQTEAAGYLLTGDAGIESLRACAEYAASIGIDLPRKVTFVQIPHHGGRHNVSTETLNMVLGPPLVDQNAVPTRCAFVSAAEKAPAHPKRIVTNAFIRRGFAVGQTKGKAVCHHSNMPVRAGWVPISCVPFYDEVEG
ncbi:hypothetical protein CFM90_17720 [Ralstonia solanacearum]|nr:hypothetical protein CFM90_17720 [Ralstonia solanacearum]RAA14790.1 hypothetical protein DOT79_16565 [Ralstonia pseudosolanacearum]